MLKGSRAAAKTNMFRPGLFFYILATAIKKGEMGSAEEYKRKFGRMETSFVLRILSYNYRRLDSEYCSCAEGINISPSGLSFKYPKVLFKDDHLKVLIHGINGLNKEEIMANVKIVWAETKDILSKRYGGRFLKITPEKKYKLIKLIRENGGN